MDTVNQTALPFTKAIILGFFVTFCLYCRDGRSYVSDGISRAAERISGRLRVIVFRTKRRQYVLHFCRTFLRIQPYYQDLAISAGMDISTPTTRGFLLNNMLPVTLATLWEAPFSCPIFFLSSQKKRYVREDMKVISSFYFKSPCRRHL